MGEIPTPVEDYAYDEEGNRSASHLSAFYGSNAHNQLLEDDSYIYTYDDRGNRVARTDKASGAVETYSYDSQNRLVGYASDATTASYTYDALDRRIAKTVDGVETAYVYDMSASDALAHDDITLEFTDTILTRRWVHSNAVDEPVGFEEYVNTSGVGSGLERTMFADRQGSVLWVADPATGVVVAGYEYDAYGQITQIAGTLVQPYGYTGREYDPESGLYYYRARNYDPANGVFVQRDPIGFGGGLFSLYSYLNGNVTYYNDPLGLSGLPVRGGVTAGFTTMSTGGVQIAAAASTTIGRGALTNAANIGLALATLSVSGDTPVDVGGGGGDDGSECYAMYVACQADSVLAAIKGNHINASHCQQCFDDCLANGYWPMYTVYTGRPRSCTPVPGR